MLEARELLVPARLVTTPKGVRESVFNLADTIEIVGSEIYDAFGNQAAVSVLFTGQYRDIELASSALPSGLDYFMARHMAPGWGTVPAAGLDRQPG